MEGSYFNAGCGRIAQALKICAAAALLIGVYDARANHQVAAKNYLIKAFTEND